MTRVFRLCLSRFAHSIWSGDGGLHADGRWHTIGHRIIYTASSLALAQLEVLVHVPRDSLPDLSYAVADIPDEVAVAFVELDDLPADWIRFAPYPPQTQKLGTEWLASGKTAVLRVPSAVSPEYGYLLNPGHPDFQRIRLGKVEPFRMDKRLFRERE